jgi:hypothetical protein
MAVSDRLNFGTSLVNGGVDEVAGLVDRELSAVGVRATFRSDEDEVRHLAARVVYREGVHPVLSHRKVVSFVENGEERKARNDGRGRGGLGRGR